MFADWQKNKVQFMALQERIAAHTVGILTDGGRGVGTGAIVRAGSKRVILTALHVLHGNDLPDLRFVFKDHGPLVEAPLRGFADKLPILHGGTSIEGEIISEPKNDIAAVVLDDKQGLTGASDCYDATAAKDIRVLDGTSILFLGFPVDNAVSVGGSTKAVAAVSEHINYDSSLADLDTLPSSFDPDNEFLMPYKWAEDKLKPYGLSGSGVWCVRTITSGVWTPNLILIGVITSYIPNLELLVAANLRSVLDLLARVG